ncbi:MAG: family 10 glycosylhydrolase [Phycisphaeraceae bacterium]|nr:family 10 glycosylhydrolase [Phycisphaeraceae bacterium]
MVRAQALGLLVLIVGLFAAACASGGDAGVRTEGQAPLPATARGGEMRGIWVTRWDYRTEADVRRVIEQAASIGATDVFWQVRGQFDAFYRSSLEPWGQELFFDRKAEYARDPARADPGFDPLATAVEAARARGVRLHAWVNVFPMWRGKTAPVDPRHPLNRNPGWRLHNDKNEPQPFNDHYVVANPTDPQVQDHIVRVCADIVTRYRVDGLHLDYVRFVSDALDPKHLYPGDAASLARYTRATGRTQVQSTQERAAYGDWIRSEITKVVTRIKTEAVAARPGVVLTAAVWRRPELARDRFFQDAAAWMDSGVLDRGMPMIYTPELAQWTDDLKAWRAASPRANMTPGMGIYMHTRPEQMIEQASAAAEANCSGVAVFAYSSMFDSVDPNQDKSARESALRAMRRTTMQRLWSAGSADAGTGGR